MLGVNHQVWRPVRRSPSPPTTDSDSSSWTTDDDADAGSSSWTTDDEADVADTAAVTTTSSTIRDGTTPTANRTPTSVEPPSNPAKRISCLLVLFLLLAPFLLRRCTDRPLSVVSRICLLTMGAFTVFRYVSHLPLLAFSITRTLSPFAGMAVLYLSTISTAGLCGSALAERRQRDGVEKSAAAVKINDKADRTTPAMSAPLLSLACAVRVLWMCFSIGPEDAVAAVFELSFMVIACLFSWTLFVDGCLLHCALFSGQALGMLGVAGCIFLYVMLFALAILFAMATAGLLGYTVYHQYKQLQAASQ
ncbi:hypothetical protein SETIT_9G318900v2 [Setaria italica]|uniref:Uncharacterized protein n=1 Tax=Setaria italica TaxID=4555 RepID=A0A368SMU0_SETIT|nr:hypothetical protein SETIT_9G318900v2 [Setaria italica]